MQEAANIPTLRDKGERPLPRTLEGSDRREENALEEDIRGERLVSQVLDVHGVHLVHSTCTDATQAAPASGAERNPGCAGCKINPSLIVVESQAKPIIDSAKLGSATLLKR